MPNFNEILAKIDQDVVTDLDFLNAIPGTPNRRQSLIKRAIAKGKLTHIRRGLYCLNDPLRKNQLNLFMLAQKIYGPSYISFESALSYHGLIPEAVPTITSATSKRSRTFKTPLGLFIYIHIPCDPFLVGVSQESPKQAPYLMASPWKALTDYLYFNKKDWKGIAPLLGSLRIEEEELKKTTKEELEELATTYRSRRIKKFLRGVKEDLKL